jgi:glycosyltransferase involved in cell wall biosynthesis
VNGASAASRRGPLEEQTMKSIAGFDFRVSGRRVLGKFARATYRLRDRLDRWLEPSYFVLHDLKRLNPYLAERGCQPLTTNPDEAEQGIPGAMRFVLGTLATRARLRRNHPRALTDGVEGGFARALLADRRLSVAGRENIRAAFAGDPSVKLRRVFEFREDLRSICPLALTPAGRGDFLSWLITHGLADFKHCAEEAIWFHFEQDEDPSRGLASTFRLLPEWQAAVPHGLTRFGWTELKNWVAERYGVRARWLRRATLPPQFGPWDEWIIASNAIPGFELLRGTPPAEVERLVRSHPLTARSADATWCAELRREIESGVATAPAVNVIGLFRYTSGLQQAVKSTVESLSRVGVRTALRDFPVLFLREPRNRDRYDAIETHPITIINTGIDLPVSEAYRKGGLHPRTGVHRIGIWWWELEELPAKWHDRDAEIDEVWAPTHFIAGAMRRAFRKPVHTLQPGVELPAYPKLGKRHFDLSPDRFTFGFVFDMNSRMQRKNPTGTIEAFRRAFHRDEPVELVIKVSPPESYYKDQWKLLTEAIAATPNVRLIDRVLDRGELVALLDSFDALVSLHRSEGFGLTCAESMLLGKPVVATGYSGNVDFMNAGNSLLVDYELATIAEDIDPYPRGSVWAEPNLDAAAAHLRTLYKDREMARAMGARAKEDMERDFSLRAAGERMRRRLEEIAASRRGQ